MTLSYSSISVKQVPDVWTLLLLLLMTGWWSNLMIFFVHSRVVFVRPETFPTTTYRVRVLTVIATLSTLSTQPLHVVPRRLLYRKPFVLYLTPSSIIGSSD